MDARSSILNAGRILSVTQRRSRHKSHLRFSLLLSWSREEVDERLKKIMKEIHGKCQKYGSEANGKVDYVKGANIGGFVKVADAMLAYGIV